jgi:hypothetical protein
MRERNDRLPWQLSGKWSCQICLSHWRNFRISWISAARTCSAYHNNCNLPCLSDHAILTDIKCSIISESQQCNFFAPAISKRDIRKSLWPVCLSTLTRAFIFSVDMSWGVLSRASGSVSPCLPREMPVILTNRSSASVAWLFITRGWLVVSRIVSAISLGLFSLHPFRLNSVGHWAPLKDDSLNSLKLLAARNLTAFSWLIWQ